MKTVTHYLALGAASVWAFSMTSAGQAVLMQYPKLSSLFAMITTILALYHVPTKVSSAGLKLIGFLLLIGITTFGMMGCNAQQSAEAVSNTITGILNIVQAEIPQFPASDQVAVQSFVSLGQSLNGQAIICEMGAGNTKAKLAGCLTTFASGLLSPTELSQLRILSPNAQKNVQIGATAAIIAINGIMTQWGQPVIPMPAVTAEGPTHEELQAFAAKLGLVYN